jgi:DNA anti-recombination protein RmuC
MPNSSTIYKITRAEAPANVGLGVGLFYEKINKQNPFDRNEKLYAEKIATRQLIENLERLQESEKQQKEEVGRIENYINQLTKDFQELHTQIRLSGGSRQDARDATRKILRNIRMEKDNLSNAIENLFYTRRAMNQIRELL